MSDQRTILVVEDNKSINHLLTTQLKRELGLPVLQAETLAETQTHLSANPDCCFVAVLDLNLPDAPNGEVVRYVQNLKIPVIVLSGNLNDDVREAMLKQNVVDYVVKQNISEIDYVTYLVDRLFRNPQHKILVVDDSTAFRKYVCALLHVHRYETIEATNGAEALQVLKDNHDISLVITDYNMPKMDGLQLVSAVRQDYIRSELSIIGMSQMTDDKLTAQFLKTGANDILRKPFQVEEFYCRVGHAIDNIEHIRTIREASMKDFLTKLYNRMYLFDAGEQLLRFANNGEVRLAVAMMDIDHFKSINDTYGHAFGDIALVGVSRELEKGLPPQSLVARFGGEEFCILLVNEKSPRDYFENLRKRIEAMDVTDGKTHIKLTMSFGYNRRLAENLDQMINLADEALYAAKHGGRNQVIEYTEGLQALQS